MLNSVGSVGIGMYWSTTIQAKNLLHWLVRRNKTLDDEGKPLR